MNLNRISRTIILTLYILVFCASAFSADHVDPLSPNPKVHQVIDPPNAGENSGNLTPTSLFESFRGKLQPTLASIAAPFGHKGWQIHRNPTLKEQNDEKLKSILVSLGQEKPEFFRLANRKPNGTESDFLSVPTDKLDEIERVLRSLQELRTKPFPLGRLEERIAPFLDQFEKTLTEKNHPATTYHAYDQFMSELTARATSEATESRSSEEQGILDRLRSSLAFLNVSIPLPPPSQTPTEPLRGSDLTTRPANP